MSNCNPSEWGSLDIFYYFILFLNWPDSKKAVVNRRYAIEFVQVDGGPLIHQQGRYLFEPKYISKLQLRLVSIL